MNFIQNFKWTKLWYFIYCTALYTVFLILFMFNYITISCIYLFLTPNSRSVFRAGVSLNIHSFIHSEHSVVQNRGITLVIFEHGQIGR